MENIVENNKLIAEFIESKNYGNLNKDLYYSVDHPSVIYFNRNCLSTRFHKDWDWLMPVVQKIKKIYPSENIGINLQKDLSIALNIKCTIEAVHKAVVDFIKWHNSLDRVSLR